MTSQYNAADLKLIRWGELVQISPSRWHTLWSIELESVDTSKVDEVISAAYSPLEGFQVELSVLGKHTVNVVVETTRWGMELDYYALTYKLFQLIDVRIGRIRLINGTPRDWWQPFRNEPKGNPSASTRKCESSREP